MTIQQAIENRERCLEYLERCAVGTSKECVEAVRLSLEALREKAEREVPKPLTIEELRQLRGMPVYLVIECIDVHEWVIIDFCVDERTGFQNGIRLLNEVYGMTWLAYRHKPKEV